MGEFILNYGLVRYKGEKIPIAVNVTVELNTNDGFSDMHAYFENSRF